MRKYFQVHDYSRNMKDKIPIFNLNGKASIWLEHLNQVKITTEKNIFWKQFKMYFQHNHLSYRYYDDKITKFDELKLGQMTMDEYVNKFMELLRYVKYIKDEKMKIKCLFNGVQ